MKRACLPALLFAATVTTACGGSADPAPAPAPTPPPSSAWSAVDQKAAAAFAGSGISGMTLTIFDRNDTKVFEKSYGNFSPTQRVPVASASKIVAGTVILRLVGQGQLSLDSTTGQLLGWTGPRAAITLRHLLSFTSGLTPNATCVSNPLITLGACVDQVGADPTALVATPGTRFDYGSTHLHVAARMAEVATGKTWNTIYSEQLRVPLEIAAESTYYTLPEQRIGTANPRVAGGMVATLDEYARILAISFHRGTYRGVTWAPAALFDQQAVAPYPGVTVGSTPMPGVSYGLGAWLECATPATGCATLSSPGAFGWTPWFDRQTGYYAVLAMYRGGQVENGVVEFSVSLAQSLRPDIAAALAAR